MILERLLPWIALGKGLDEVTTILALRYGGGYESNAIPAFLYRSYGYLGHLIAWGATIALFWLYFRFSITVDAWNGKFKIALLSASFVAILYIASSFVISLNNVAAWLF
jgi:hypothetical protein